MTQQNDFKTTKAGWSKALPALLIPVCVGMSLYLVIGATFDQGLVSNETLVRYLTGHPISRITLAMFCVGMASLFMIADNVFQQFRRAESLRLRENTRERARSVSNSNPPDPNELHSDPTVQQPLDSATASPEQRATAFLEWLNQYPTGMQQYYLWRRLEAAMQYICRNGSAAGVEDELKYQADLDIDRQQQRYSLVRILVWATPMLGFLGTVLGISQALGGIQVGPENDFQQMMSGLRSSLYVAFDTTALALTLSIILMFVQFLVDRFETQLLQLVNESATRQVTLQFASDAQIDPQANALERIGRTILATSHQLVHQQAEIWNETIRAAESTWRKSVNQANDTVGQNLEQSVEHAVESLNQSLGNSIERADESMSKRWEQWQVALSDNARNLATGQVELQKQTTLLEQVLSQLNNVESIQGTVNTNLETLTSTSRMHHTLEQLSEVIGKLQQALGETHFTAESTPINERQPNGNLAGSHVGPQSGTNSGPIRLRIYPGDEVTSHETPTPTPTRLSSFRQKRAA